MSHSSRNTTTPILDRNYSHSEISMCTAAKNANLLGKTIHYWGLKYHVRAPSKVSWVSVLFQLCGQLHTYKSMSWLTHKHTTCWLHRHIWGYRWWAEMHVQNTRHIPSYKNQAPTVWKGMLMRPIPFTVPYSYTRRLPPNCCSSTLFNKQTFKVDSTLVRCLNVKRS